MIDINVKRYDATYNFIDCDESVAADLNDFFSFTIPNYQIMKAKNPRLKYWDGTLRLFSRKKRLLYVGLTSKILELAADRSYLVERYSLESQYSLEDAKLFVEDLQIPAHIQVRDYQLNYFVKSVRKGRALVVSPTASGKSLIIYLLFRYYKEKSLIIVPTINLIAQMVSHFNEYGYTADIHKVHAGQEKFSDNILTISTWQSLANEQNYANNFGLVIVDECHTAKAKVLKGLLEDAISVDHRFGFTGTLLETECHCLVLEGLFGEIIQEITTSELINQGHIADLKIKILLLKYSEAECKAFHKAKLDYAHEMEYICQHEGRMKFLLNLIQSLNGNTIVLFRFVDTHGKMIYNSLKEKSKNPVYYIAGSVSLKGREEIRHILRTDDNSDLVASYGTCSTGFDSASLKHVIFASPYKSKVPVLQSIGRGLRLFEGKDCVIYDIVDDFSYKNKSNYTIHHFLKRLEIYNEQQFKYKVMTIKL